MLWYALEAPRWVCLNSEMKRPLLKHMDVSEQKRLLYESTNILCLRTVLTLKRYLDVDVFFYFCLILTYSTSTF